jgi:hypothetical protein
MLATFGITRIRLQYPNTAGGRHINLKHLKLSQKQEVMQRINSLIFLTLFNNTVSLALFKYRELRTLSSMVTLIPWLMWLNNGSNYGTHCCTIMDSTVTRE